MIEKRSFMLGHLIGGMAYSNLSIEVWIPAVINYCKVFNMTVPDKQELKDLADFMEYALKIYRGPDNQ